MPANKKTMVTGVISGLVGFVVGGIAIGSAVAYFFGHFISDNTAMASSNQLNFNIAALESIRSSNNSKAIEQLEMEARMNLITVGAFEEQVSSSTGDVIIKSIANAKTYFEKNPIKYVVESEKQLVEQAYRRIEESHNKQRNSDSGAIAPTPVR